MLKGVVGYITWHYYTAAQLEGYTVTRNKAGTAWALTATVVLSDAFKIAQSPLTFVAKHTKGEWRFPIVSCQIAHGVITAHLQPPEASTP